MTGSTENLSPEWQGKNQRIGWPRPQTWGKEISCDLVRAAKSQERVKDSHLLCQMKWKLKILYFNQTWSSSHLCQKSKSWFPRSEGTLLLCLFNLGSGNYKNHAFASIVCLDAMHYNGKIDVFVFLGCIDAILSKLSKSNQGLIAEDCFELVAGNRYHKHSKKDLQTNC